MALITAVILFTLFHSLTPQNVTGKIQQKKGLGHRSLVHNYVLKT
jgi:hypothetical protein